MASKLRKAIGAVKDQTTISLAKVGSAGFPDVDIALVKATSHEEAPLEENYVQELLYLTSGPKERHVDACIAGLTKRLRKTRNWIVAIKTLMLAHRLIRDGDPAIEHKLASSRKKGTRVLNVYDFRDESHSNSGDLSAFVRAYGLYLDERLDSCVPSLFSFKSQKPPSSNSQNANGSNHNLDSASGSDEDASRGKMHQNTHKRRKPVKTMRPPELMKKFPFFQQLLERALACRPSGTAKLNRLVLFSLQSIVRESFLVYSDIRDGMAILLDAFIDMDHLDCIGAFDIYSRAAKQVDELASFYSLGKALGVCKLTEYPVVDKISEELLEIMDASVRLRLDPTTRGGSMKTKTPQARSVSFEDDVEDESSSEMNGMRELRCPTPESHLTSKPFTKSVNLAERNINNEVEEDLLSLEKEPAMSFQEHEEKLALALFSGTEMRVNTTWENISLSLADAENGTDTSRDDEKEVGHSIGKAGWELALIESEVDLSKPINDTHTGGFNRLLLDSLYDQGTEQKQKITAAIRSTGSASSVALPTSILQSNFLVLPAPPESGTETEAIVKDPFAASLNVPPPAYVQMAEMRRKQLLLVHEQQQWLQYQYQGINGFGGPINFATNPFATTFQPAAYPTACGAVHSYFG